MPKIITRIAIKEREEDEARKRLRPVDPSPFYENPFRRRGTLPKKHLKVFDWARAANGLDIPFFFGENTVLGPNPEDKQYSPFSSNFWDSWGNTIVVMNFVDILSAWNSQLLSGDRDEWVDEYYDLTEDLANYEIAIDPLETYIPGLGLEIPEHVTSLKGTASSINALKWMMTGDAGSVTPYFPRWLDMNVSFSFAPYKITREPIYSADSAILRLDKSIDVFLAPALFSGSGEARDEHASLPTFPTFPYLPQAWYFAGIGMRNVPRSTIEDPTWDTFWAGRGSNYHTLPQALKEYGLNMFINNGHVPLFTLNTGTTWVHPGPIYITDIVEGVAGFPLKASGVRNRIFINPSFYVAGSLVAAVRKHIGPHEYEWYYIWAAGHWTTLNNIIAGNAEI